MRIVNDHVPNAAPRQKMAFPYRINRYYRPCFVSRNYVAKGGIGFKPLHYSCRRFQSICGVTIIESLTPADNLDTRLDNDFGSTHG